jgi:hypothetical protein
MRFFHDLRIKYQTFWRGKPIEEWLDAHGKSIKAENDELREANEYMWLKYLAVAQQLNQSARAHRRKTRIIKTLRKKNAQLQGAKG